MTAKEKAESLAAREYIAKAEARYIRTSPQKARLVVDLIRGISANEARIVLRSTNKRLAPTVLKVLDSAIANATNKDSNMDVDALFVTRAYVNEGPRQKRIRPAPMGRAYRYQRRMAHIVVKVGDRAQLIAGKQRFHAPEAEGKQ